MKQSYYSKVKDDAPYCDKEEEKTNENEILFLVVEGGQIHQEGKLS